MSQDSFSVSDHPGHGSGLVWLDSHSDDTKAKVLVQAPNAHLFSLIYPIRFIQLALAHRIHIIKTINLSFY